MTKSKTKTKKEILKIADELESFYDLWKGVDKRISKLSKLSEELIKYIRSSHTKKKGD